MPMNTPVTADAMPALTEQGWDLDISPFHSGELAIQDRVGVREKIDRPGRRSTRRFMTQQHRAFFPQLPCFFMASVDETGQPWASMLVGTPGFLDPLSDIALRVRVRPLLGDPLNRTLREGAPVAGLGIEFTTRRRNRMIGTASRIDDDGFTIDIKHTLGICPRYIQSREMEFVDASRLPAPKIIRSVTLHAAAKAIIQRSDAYFVASNDPRPEDGITGGADISHRGGRPGFVRVDNDLTLTAPDFIGNFMFNTLGNLSVDPRAGLLFVDFENGDLLYLATRAEIIWDGPELKAFMGAQRLVRYRVTSVIHVEKSLPARFGPVEYSPVLERIGDWGEVARTLKSDR